MNLFKKVTTKTAWIGAVRSRIVWTSLLLIVLNSWLVDPSYLDYIQKLTGISLQSINFWLGILVTLLRFDTTDSLADK